MLITTTGTAIWAHQKAILSIRQTKRTMKTIVHFSLALAEGRFSRLVEPKIIWLPSHLAASTSRLAIYIALTQDLKSTSSPCLQSFVPDPEQPTSIKAYGITSQSLLI